ncbi:MAG: hypothetical protein K5924_10910 [Chloroflexi bacterium]|nr:hypothetical protein [Chloroflexota bacterium]
MVGSGGPRARWLVVATLALVAPMSACASPPAASSDRAEPSASPATSPTGSGSARPEASVLATPEPSLGTVGVLDGLIAYGAVDPDGVSQVHLLDLATSESRQLTHLTEEETRIVGLAISPVLSCAYGIHTIAWSPDGQRLAFTYGGCEGVVFMTDLDGRHRRIGEGSGPTWSPDGSRLAFGRNIPYTGCGNCVPPGGPFQLQVADLSADGRVTDLTRTADPAFTATAPLWSPDGAMIAFHGPLPAPDPTGQSFGGTYVVKPDGSSMQFAHHGFATRWLDDGRLAISLDGQRPQTLIVEPGAGGGEPLGPDVVDVSPSGAYVFSSAFDAAGTSSTVVRTVDGARAFEVDERPTWDSAGTHVSAVRLTPMADAHDLVVYPLDGSDPLVYPLAGMPDAPGAHAWQPAGEP